MRQPLVGYTALDSTESSAVLRFNIKRGIDAIAAHAGASVLRGHLEVLTGCTIVRQSVIYPAINPSAAAPIAGALATRVGVFIFSTATPGNYGIVEIPGLLDSCLQITGPGAGLLINRDDPAVQALVTELVSGAWLSPFGLPLVRVEAAFLQIRP